MRGPSAIPALLAVLLAALPAAARAGGGAFKDSPHGNKETGVRRVPGLPRGDCGHCHGAARDPTGRRGDGGGHARLAGGNDNGLCTGCHKHPGPSYLGDARYAESAHGRSPAAVWPGPVPRARSSEDAGKCVNCHDPHGMKDGKGLVPSLMRRRGVAQCLTCHRGDPAPDVASSFARAFRHPLVADPAPAALGSSPSSLAGPGGVLDPSVAAGDATCSACHNPHVAGQDTVRPVTAGALRSLAGVARVLPAGSAAGSGRTFTLALGSEGRMVREYEVCFKCHSGGTRRPVRGADLAALFNPANPSFHPVEAQGRNRSVERRAFTQGWSGERLVTCSDCHGSDDETQRGPHGSANAHILRRQQPSGPADQQVQETDLCFACHAYRTYGEAKVGAVYSRWAGHGSHSARGTTCWTCHDAHGSATLPALLVSRPSGLAAYSQDLSGGTCTTTCHTRTSTRSTYRASYSR
jgi:predicted CXXCH cytochrome family protein